MNRIKERDKAKAPSLSSGGFLGANLSPNRTTSYNIPLGGPTLENAGINSSVGEPTKKPPTPFKPTPGGLVSAYVPKNWAVRTYKQVKGKASEFASGFTSAFTTPETAFKAGETKQYQFGSKTITTTESRTPTQLAGSTAAVVFSLGTVGRAGSAKVLTSPAVIETTYQAAQLTAQALAVTTAGKYVTRATRPKIGISDKTLERAYGSSLQRATADQGLGKQILAEVTPFAVGKESLRQAAETELKSRGYTGKQLSAGVNEIVRTRTYMGVTEAGALLNIARGSEKIGRSLITKSFDTAKKSFPKSKTFRETFKKTFVPIARAGAAEGASSVVAQRTGRFQQVKPGEVLIGTGAGAVSAGVIGGVIAGTKAFKPGVSKIVEYSSYITDPFEKPGDLLQDATEAVSRRVGKKTFKVPTITVTSNTVSLGTTTNTRKGGGEIGGTKTPIAALVPTTINPRTKTTIPTTPPVPVSVQTPVPVPEPTPTPVQNPVPVPVQTPVPVPVQTPVPVPVPANVPVRVQVPVTIPNIRIPGGIPPFIPAAGGLFSYKGPKLRNKKIRAYTPSFYAAGLGIKGKAKKAAVTTGLGLRPITQGKKKKKSFLKLPRVTIGSRTKATSRSI